MFKPLIINKENFTEYELFELSFQDFLFNKPLTLVSWISNDNTLEKLNLAIPEEYRYATILKWSWVNPSFKKLIIEKLGFKKIFCPSVKKGLATEQIPYFYNIKEDIYCGEKDTFISFIGWNSNKIRNLIFKLFKECPSVIERKEFFNESDDTKRNEYIKLLARSRFSLCPRGIGENTIRFWESLKAGAIPILISNCPLPDCWDWSNTIIRFSEYEFLTYPFKLNIKTKIAKARENKLRENCLKAFKFFNNKENIINYINEKL